MNYIIFDLEFNQNYNNKNENLTTLSSKCPFEIIQIGAIKLDSNHNKTGVFNALVKPSIYKTIHPFVKKLTGITMDNLMLAKDFNKIFDDFSSFVKDDDDIFCVWGLGDMKELFRNIKYHKIEHTNIPKKYINIQCYASKYLKTPNRERISLKNAIEFLNIPIKNQFHDAFNDAYYTAEIFKKLKMEAINPKIYDPVQIRSHNKYRTKKNTKRVDFNGLVNQIEKMYNRKMTKEEISMITISYKMGATHQFLKQTKT